MKNEKLINIRKKKKVTQQDLASKCGVSRQTISGIEIGSFNPSYELMCAICRALGAKTFDEVFSIPVLNDDDSK